MSVRYFFQYIIVYIVLGLIGGYYGAMSPISFPYWVSTGFSAFMFSRYGKKALVSILCLEFVAIFSSSYIYSYDYFSDLHFFSVFN